MAMTPEEILNSGILELYVLGQLSEEESRTLEQAIGLHPELKSEIREIEKALYKYDNIFEVTPPSGILDNLISETSDGKEANSKGNNSFNAWSLLSIAMAAAIVAGFFFFNGKLGHLDNVIKEQQSIINDCEEKSTQYDQQLQYYDEILDYRSQKLVINPSDNYGMAQLIIHNNPVTGKNYLQINNLPDLADNQSFQLWSLKGDNPPIPLDVFQDDTGKIIEMQFIENTNAYAITIEPIGGSVSPTLENLVGVFELKS